VLAGLYAALSLVLAIQAGKWSDRLGPVRPMLLGSVLSCGGLIIAWAFPSIRALYVSAAVMGAGFIFFNVAVQSLVALMSRPQDRARDFSILSQGYSVSALIAPLSAGFAVKYLGSAGSFLLFAFAAIVPALILFGMRELHSLRPESAATQRSSVVELLRDRPLRSSFVTSGLVVTGWDLYTFYLPVYAHGIGLDAAVIGAILAVFGAAAFTVRWFMPPLVRRWGEAGLLARAMLVAALFYLAFPFAKTPYVLGALSIALGLTLGLGQPLSMMITYARAPAARAGEANGLRLMVNHFTHFLVPILSGGLGTAFGVGPVFWMNSACLALAARVLKRY
jgi:predicted MFS family arabinose efflux permease